MEERLRIRISRDLRRRMKAYCSQHRIENESAFIRHAITNQITPDVEDSTLVFESLRQLHDRLHSIEQQIDVFFAFFCFTVRHFLVYNAEIPAEHKEAAAASAMARYEKLFKAFQNTMKQTPSMFESLLADFVEEHNDQ